MRKPLIGLIPLVDEGRDSFWMLPGYMEGVARAGGLAVMLPLTDGDADIEELVSRFDAFLFTGGHDLEPAMYGEEKLPLCGDTCPGRDAMEGKLLRAALAADKPVLGICRGLQLMNAVLGGTLWQDIRVQFPSETNHRMAAPYGRAQHTVQVCPELPFGELPLTLGVNSCHHQGIRKLAPNLRARATAPDGLVEAVYLPGKRYARAVQWHPEFFPAEDTLSRAIFGEFIDAARERLRGDSVDFPGRI